MPNTPTSVNPAVLQLSVNLSEAQRLVAPAATELSFAFTCEHWVLSRKPLLVTQKHIVSVAVGVNVASHAPPIESLLQILPRLVASITFADLHTYTVQLTQLRALSLTSCCNEQLGHLLQLEYIDAVLCLKWQRDTLEPKPATGWLHSLICQCAEPTS